MTINGSTGITDTSGNNLANFTYQLDNFSSQDYTAPDGWTDPTDGNSIRFNFSESVAHFGDYDAATGSVTGGTFDPARIKDAITINVDGRNLNPADYSFSKTATAFASTSITSTRASTRDKPSPSPTTKPSSQTLIDSSTSAATSSAQARTSSPITQPSPLPTSHHRLSISPPHPLTVKPSP